jgi:hypothetical protein
VLAEVKSAMRLKCWRAATMALLMCSPIRPVPPIMRMFCEVVIVDVGDCRVVDW